MRLFYPQMMQDVFVKCKRHGRPQHLARFSYLQYAMAICPQNFNYLFQKTCVIVQAAHNLFLVLFLHGNNADT